MFVEKPFKMDEDNELNHFFDNINNINDLNNINHLNNREQLIIQKRKHHVQERRDPLEIFDNDEFKRRFRISKEEVRELYHMIEGDEHLEPLVIRFKFI